MIGLGCMRFSTDPLRTHAGAIGVIHAALDAGATLLDTADAYALNENEIGHNERLIAEALRTWRGDRSTIEVATKGGLTRPGGRWVPDGRATHLRAACDASRRALEVDAIDLYQLHAVDPRTPIERSVRALASLQQEGHVRAIGLCNVTVAQIEAARRIIDIASVQVSLSVLDEENVRNGVAEYCRDHGIRLIAYRPLGGIHIRRIARDQMLAEIAVGHGATPHEIALAWLLDLGSGVIPIPGATREASARSIGRVSGIHLTDQDRRHLDARFPAGHTLRVPRSVRRPAGSADGEVVLVMGMPGAGKTTVARELVEHGYRRLNRDELGGALTGLVRELDAGINSGQRRWVLDNTYPSRGARNEVIECSWRHGLPVRCIWLTTSVADAQINAATRLVRAEGRLPPPEELRERGRSDHRFFGPDAQFRYERRLEPPSLDEGFTAIEQLGFTRNPAEAEGSAVVLEFDQVLCASANGAPTVLDPSDVRVPEGRRDTLARHCAEGRILLGIAWRPQVAAGAIDENSVRDCYDRLRELLGLDIDFAHCPHAAGPPVCWCRKPLPGLVIEFAFRHGLALDRCAMVGRSAADRTLASRLGMTYHDHVAFFDS